MPIVPHEMAGLECCGCIVAAGDGSDVELRCNECVAVVGVIQVDIFKGLLGLGCATTTRPHCDKAGGRCLAGNGIVSILSGGTRLGMERIEKTVFLSYRRTNIPWALAIYQNLTQHGYHVFFDYNGVVSGDFESIILENIKARAHFLVLLTPSALERCGDPTDWLRREIETALATQRNTVPLMLEGFDFGTPKIAGQLTGMLAALKHYNGLSIPPEYFMEAMGRLRDRYLNLPLTAVLHPASTSVQRVATEQKAAADAAPAVQEEELTAQQWFERGFATTDVDEALRFYDEAIRLKRDYSNAFYNRGVARSDKGDIEGALKDYDEAIRLKPDSADTFNNRGILRRTKGDLEGALKDYDEAIRLKPDYAGTFNNRGIARRAKGDVEGALKDYNEAIRLKPDYANAFYNRGIARSNKGDIEGELTDYDEAIRLKPDYAEAFYNRAVACRHKGDIEGALKDFDEAIRLKPDSATVFNNRGLARRTKGDLTGALKDYNEAIRLKPDYAKAFYNRAVARRDKGDMEGATQDYNELIRLKPDFAED
jgi:tetratricopeptide (TPR) repeat protein